MTIFEFAVTYAVCWWLVLFMVLPHQAQALAKPEIGHAPSAPAKPQLRRKMLWTTFLAIIPAVAMCFIVNDAKAEDGIYRTTSSKCKPLNVHQPRDDVAARDGYSTGGKKVKPATLGGENPYVAESYDLPLRVPADGYLNNTAGQQQSLTDSFIGAGTVSVGKDGTTTLNGKPVEAQETYPEECDTTGE